MRRRSRRMSVEGGTLTSANETRLLAALLVRNSLCLLAVCIACIRESVDISSYRFPG